MTRTFIIAEAGVNHNGRWETGLDLIDAAKEARADAVKFQHFNSQRLWGNDRIKHLELSEAALTAMHAHCQEVGIEFMCSPFGVEEVKFLAPMLRRVKVASGMLARMEFLEAVAATELPVIMSTGMSDMWRVSRAIDPLQQHCLITLLHCTSAYPCPPDQVNLAAMEALRATRLPVGYSDHTEGICVALAAVARGAVVLEKHLTLDRQAPGPDHKASIEPAEFNLMVSEIRQIEFAIGDPAKRVQPSEEACRKAWYGDQR